ncbi:uncharacterized protein LOC114853759 [Betta splendens]|uniref:Uncharacterized protein LOC114853759 n=1 Tax=Betta splendens TaxID=158456 RepID=A0A6P7M9U1_BETSP|nr:uncharacterized protein LOC114853759 [Betta splendens]
MDEIDVAQAFSFPPGSKQRRVLLESLRNKGDWQHNCQVLQDGDGEIVTWKQPSANVSVEDYLPCQHCYAMFKRTELWRHERSCRSKKPEDGGVNVKRNRVQKASSHLIPKIQSCEGVENIICNMLQDSITFHIRGDIMICTYGQSLFAKKGREQCQHRYIAQKMRELGRLVLAAKEIDSGIVGLKDLCEPTKFPLVIKATQRVANYTANNSEYGKPSTAVKIGFSLKGATEAWIGHCLITSDLLIEKKTKKFKELLDCSWSSYVSTNAHSTMEQRRWNMEECVPLTEDIITLQNYLRKCETQAKEELCKHVTTAAYKRLSESLLAQIIVFNKKREGEASRLSLKIYQNTNTGPVNKEIYETLSPVEKQMSHRLTRIVTRGKRGRKVPILLLERTKSSIDFLIQKRKEVGILEENPFLFARIGSLTNLRGCDCLRKFAAESKVNNPELLRSTKLRKHIATLCQLLDLDNQELEQVARFMGHDIRVHCQYYRQTDKTFQVAKIGKLLFAMEKGAGQLKGKSLKTLDSVVLETRDDCSVSPAKSHKTKARVCHEGNEDEDNDGDEEQLKEPKGRKAAKESCEDCSVSSTKRQWTKPRVCQDADEEEEQLKKPKGRKAAKERRDDCSVSPTKRQWNKPRLCRDDEEEEQLKEPKSKKAAKESRDDCSVSPTKRRWTKPRLCRDDEEEEQLKEPKGKKAAKESCDDWSVSPTKSHKTKARVCHEDNEDEDNDGEEEQLKEPKGKKAAKESRDDCSVSPTKRRWTKPRLCRDDEEEEQLKEPKGKKAAKESCDDWSVSPTKSHKTKARVCHEDNEDEDNDGEEEQLKEPKGKKAAKESRDDCSVSPTKRRWTKPRLCRDDEEEEQLKEPKGKKAAKESRDDCSVSPTKSHTTKARVCHEGNEDEDNDEDEKQLIEPKGRKDASKVNTRRPWTNIEKNAVLQRMHKYIAVRRVPGKIECLGCILKASPVLKNRTWKDVKYVVHNEIIKIKRQLSL